MDFEKRWTPGDISEREGELLDRYHKQQGGVLFVEVNTAYPRTGSLQRRLDGVLFPEPPSELDGHAYHYTPGNRPGIRELFSEYVAELIEVHGWGFFGFGQVVGKSRLVELEWDPYATRRVFVPTNPEKLPDPATEAVFEDFGIEVVSLD